MSRFDDKPVGGDEQGRPYLVHVSRHLDPDRARGALLGLAVGDALGTTLEFTERGEPSFATPLVGPHADITGGGPFGVAPGQVTDDTQMATALARSLMERGGFVPQAVADAYVSWAESAFDIGTQTAAALHKVADGRPPREAGHAVWLEGGRRAAGNGSLMRTTPIALFYYDDGPRRREVAMAESAITHYDPRCQLACAAFDGAIAAAVHGPPKRADELVAIAREELGMARNELVARAPVDEQEIDTAAWMLAEDLDDALRDDPGLYTASLHLGRMAGYVRVAFRLAFWELVHARSFEGALIDVANRGGDADTNAAITGALLGAHRGASAIPPAWSERVLRALAGSKGPLATHYHPRQLLELLPWED